MSQNKFANVFFPPELSDAMEDSDDLGVGITGKTDSMRRLFFQKNRSTAAEPKVDNALVSLVLDHAKKVIAHPSKPRKQHIEQFTRHPFGDFAIEESLEENPWLENPDDLLVTYETDKPFSCVTMLDISSSMSGEKHLLSSVAIAVLLLEVEPRDASVIVFNSDAKVIKKLQAEERREEVLKSFLKTKPRGFTNIASGLELGLKEFGGAGSGRRKIGLIATDGRSTEGKDPVEIARGFDSLIVLHLHGPGSHIEASKEMAIAGNGVCLEVERFEDLPRRLYDAIRLLART